LAFPCAPSQTAVQLTYTLARRPAPIAHLPGQTWDRRVYLAGSASQYLDCVSSQPGVGRVADVGLLHSGVAAHGPHPKATLFDRQLDHLASEVIDQLGAQATGEFADGGLVGNLGYDRDPAEATKVEGVGHLSDQPLVAPAVTMLERHQAQVGRHRDAGPADLELGPAPLLLELLEHSWSIQHLVQTSQIGGQEAHEIGKEAVPDGVDLAVVLSEHIHQ
jgi:hypothetical protein